MKFSKLWVTALMMFWISVDLASVSYADDSGDGAKVKDLYDASAALKTVKPGLSVALAKFADEEAAEVKGKEEEKEVAEKGEDETTEKKERVEHIKLLRDAGSALKTSKPELALALLEMADKSERKMADENTKEMAGVK